eukprot:754794-Hanusia_phi.AAC.12
MNKEGGEIVGAAIEVAGAANVAGAAAAAAGTLRMMHLTLMQMEGDCCEESGPTEVNTSTISHLVKVNKDKLTVMYNGKANHRMDVGSVQANRPFSRSSLVGYFEMTVLNAGTRGYRCWEATWPHSLLQLHVHRPGQFGLQKHRTSRVGARVRKRGEETCMANEEADPTDTMEMTGRSTVIPPAGNPTRPSSAPRTSLAAASTLRAEKFSSQRTARA